jgi:hypothetical protein
MGTDDVLAVDNRHDNLQADDYDAKNEIVPPRVAETLVFVFVYLFWYFHYQYLIFKIQGKIKFQKYVNNQRDEAGGYSI